MMARKTVGWASSQAELIPLGQEFLAWEETLAAYRGYQDGTMFYLGWLGSWGGFTNVVQVTGQVPAIRIYDGPGPRCELDRELEMTTEELWRWRDRGELSGPFTAMFDPWGWVRAGARRGFPPKTKFIYFWNGHVEGFEGAGWSGQRYWFHLGVQYAKRVDKDKFATPGWPDGSFPGAPLPVGHR